MDRFNARTVGWTTAVAGLAAVLASLALLGFFGGSGLLGSAGDLLDMANSALVVPLFVLLGNLTRGRSETAGRAVQLAGVLGAIARLVGAFLIVSGLMIYDDAVLLVNAGLGLIGIAMVIFFVVNRGRPFLSRGYVIFSLVVGVVLALGLLGVFLNDVFTPLLRGEVTMAEFNPLLLLLLFTLSPIQILGYPLWLLWTGRRLLQGPRLEEQAAAPI